MIVNLYKINSFRTDYSPQQIMDVPLDNICRYWTLSTDLETIVEVHHELESGR
jgi:hypothetical protein